MHMLDSSVCNKVSGGHGNWGGMPGGSYPANIMPNGPRLPGERPIGPQIIEGAKQGALEGIQRRGLSGAVPGAVRGAIKSGIGGIADGVAQQG